MTWQAWLTVSTVVGMFAVLVSSNISTDVVLLGAVAVLLTSGVVSPSEAFGGFANEGMLTVAFLFVVAGGLRETGAITFFLEPILGRPKSTLRAQARMMFPVAFFSAIVNNTPIVAMMVPVIGDWAKKHNLSVSKLMIPLSYATVLGGTCTLIGTSANLIVNGLLIREGRPGLHLLDNSLVGLPCAAAGLIYILIFSRWLLTDRRPPIGKVKDPREYIVEMMVEPSSALVGKTIEKAGLRHLPGMYLIEIEREGDILPAVAPEEKLRANDRLVFAGVVETVVDLQRFRGLVPATDQVFKLNAPRSQRCLIEAVVSDSCPIVGMTIRDGRFRSQYDAAVIAVTHNGQHVRKKIGDIILQAGDTLLLEAHPSFVDRQRNSRDFFLVSPIEDSTPPPHDRAWISLAILATMVILAANPWRPLNMLIASMLGAGAMVVTGACPVRVARRSVDWQVLIAIGASFGVGKAIQASGVAGLIASELIGLGGTNPWVALAIIYGITLLFTELITNSAAAVLVFPIALATSQTLGVDFMPFVSVIMMAASSGFATPIGYQTHLMVYGPGGYRFSDFVKIGLPLDILIWIIAVAVIPFVWPFYP